MLSFPLSGIGLNVNQELFDPSLPNPVSVKQLSGKERVLEEELQILLACLDRRYDMLRSGNNEALDRDYNESLFGYNQWRKYCSQEKPFEGMTRGVDEFGRLILTTRSGEAVFIHGEVSFLED